MDLSKIFLKNACPTSIGGQAILEGIMMRGPARTAIALRLPDDRIFLKTQPNPKATVWSRIPLVRGVVNFVMSLVQGTKVLMYSADKLEEFSPEVYEKDKFDVWVEEKLGKQKAWNILMIFSVALALILSVAIFMLVPTVITGWISRFTDSVLLKNLVEGLVRVMIFVAYILLVGRMKDIKTVFQYHGAEHKTIHCFENGLELTPANAQQFYTLHPRCGTSFLVFVLLIAILVHAFMGWPNVTLRIVSRILVLPVIAGLSYELLKWAGRSDNLLVKILSIPGLYAQKLTTREPSDAQLEVAIVAMKAVLKPADTPYYEGICDLNADPVPDPVPAPDDTAKDDTPRHDDAVKGDLSRLDAAPDAGDVADAAHGDPAKDDLPTEPAAAGGEGNRGDIGNPDGAAADEANAYDRPHAAKDRAGAGTSGTDADRNATAEGVPAP